MATVITTGRDLTLTVGGIDYNDQAASVTLTQEMTRETYEVLSGKVKRKIDEDGSLTIELFGDWGSATPSSILAALWNAADTDPDTSLAFTFSANGAEFSGFVFPVKPDVGGTAPDAITTTVELPLDGAVTYTAPA